MCNHFDKPIYSFLLSYLIYKLQKKNKSRALSLTFYIPLCLRFNEIHLPKTVWYLGTFVSQLWQVRLLNMPSNTIFWIVHLIGEIPPVSTSYVTWPITALLLLRRNFAPVVPFGVYIFSCNIYNKLYKIFSCPHNLYNGFLVNESLSFMTIWLTTSCCKHKMFWVITQILVYDASPIGDEFQWNKRLIRKMPDYRTDGRQFFRQLHLNFEKYSYLHHLYILYTQFV